MENTPALRRALSLPLLVLYGLGTTIGAGIYALIGRIAGLAGPLAPLAFLMAALVAALTALSYAEMAARYPRAAGTALYVREGFSSRRLSTLTGLVVAAAGLSSAAALAIAFAGYLAPLTGLPPDLSAPATVLVLGALAAWGIRESVTAAALATLVEVGGLLLVIGANLEALGSLPERAARLAATEPLPWSGLLAGTLLAFYAFIGFEDMVVVAEETRAPTRTLPRAILLTLALTTGLYVLLVTVAVAVMEPAELAASSAPLADLYARGGGDPALLGVVALFAIVNGALIQIIMASRLLYGLAAQGQLPAFLARVGRRTRTPLAATALTTLAVLALTLAGGLEPLAAATSLLMLCIFALVNLALLRVRRLAPPPGIRPLPAWVPALGFLTSALLALRELAARLA